MPFALNIVRYTYHIDGEQLSFDIGTSEADIVTPEDMSAGDYPEWTKQYFALQEDEEPDWELEGLKQFYQELEQLNKAFSERIRGIEQSDAISNSMVMFFAASIVVADALEEHLAEYKDYFTGLSVTPPKGG